MGSAARRSTRRRGLARVSLSLPLCAVLALSVELAGQALGVHPHIAPINSAAANAGYSQAPGTPQLNVPDGIWNHGEGFLAQSTSDADHGGHLGSVEPGVELADIFGVEQTIGGTPG